jgi:hypothetical protein
MTMPESEVDTELQELQELQERRPRHRDPFAGERKTGNDRLIYIVLGGITVGLLFALVVGINAPKRPWAFDSPAAQMPLLQQKHTLQ